MTHTYQASKRPRHWETPPVSVYMFLISLLSSVCCSSSNAGAEKEHSPLLDGWIAQIKSSCCEHTVTFKLHADNPLHLTVFSFLYSFVFRQNVPMVFDPWCLFGICCGSPCPLYSFPLFRELIHMPCRQNPFLFKYLALITKLFNIKMLGCVKVFLLADDGTAAAFRIKTFIQKITNWQNKFLLLWTTFLHNIVNVY